MTPLARFYAQFLPAGWVYPAVTLNYLLGLLALALLARNPAERTNIQPERRLVARFPWLSQVIN